MVHTLQRGDDNEYGSEKSASEWYRLPGDSQIGQREDGMVVDNVDLTDGATEGQQTQAWEVSWANPPTRVVE